MVNGVKQKKTKKGFQMNDVVDEEKRRELWNYFHTSTKKGNELPIIINSSANSI